MKRFISRAARRVWSPIASKTKWITPVTVLHTAAALGFISVLWLLIVFLPSNTPVTELVDAIQLLAQVLAIIVGILIIGTSVYAGSYDVHGSLHDIHAEIESISEPVREAYSKEGRRRFSIKKESFRGTLLRNLQITDLIFRSRIQHESMPHYITRRFWDGVWYWVFESPFRTAERSNKNMLRIQAAHEAVICSYRVLKIISHMRDSNAALLTQENGTRGSIAFIKALEQQPLESYKWLPDKMTVAQADRVLGLAVESDHYMWEELLEHSEELNWDPYQLSQFYLEFVDYIIWMTHLFTKIQNWRTVNIESGFPMLSRRGSWQTPKNRTLMALADARRKASDVRRKSVMVYGVARYFMDLRRASVPGASLAVTSLFFALIGWPLIVSSPAGVRLIEFAFLYSAGIAALIESAGFLGRMLWGKSFRRRYDFK